METYYPLGEDDVRSDTAPDMVAAVSARASPALETVTRGSSRSVNGSAADDWMTSRDHVALQFFWQGYDAYVQCKDKESVAPCFYNGQCAGQSADGEFVQIVPVEEVRERHILDDMRVQLLSVSSSKYLRATHVSKFLKWSRSRDEQTVFRIQMGDRKPLTTGSKFTLTSCFWPDRAVGFTQTFPLGGSRELTKAMGFLTLEKKKNQAPLLFPIRFRAVLRELRDNRGAPEAAFRRPTPFVTATDLLFIGEENADSVNDIPLARVASSSTSSGGRRSSSGRLSDLRLSSLGEEIWENCTFCGRLFHVREELLAHIRDYHGEILHRTPVPGAFCIHCGSRRADGRCTRCGRGNDD